MHSTLRSGVLLLMAVLVSGRRSSTDFQSGAEDPVQLLADPKPERELVSGLKLNEDYFIQVWGGEETCNHRYLSYDNSCNMSYADLYDDPGQLQRWRLVRCAPASHVICMGLLCVCVLSPKLQSLQFVRKSSWSGTTTSSDSCPPPCTSTVECKAV